MMSVTMQSDPGFRPFFFPEFGWVFVLVGSGALLAIVRGRIRPDLEQRVRSGAPVRLMLGLLIISMASAVALGAGIVLSARTVAVWSGVVGGIALGVGWVLVQWHRAPRDE